MKKQELIELLKRTEVQLTHDPRNNAWDLGPSDVLIDVRYAVGIVRDKQNRVVPGAKPTQRVSKRQW